MSETGSTSNRGEQTDAFAYRARLYRLAFYFAAIYNVAFGVWAAAWPLAFFAIFELELPRSS